VQKEKFIYMENGMMASFESNKQESSCAIFLQGLEKRECTPI
jgi:hypothetical protein